MKKYEDRVNLVLRDEISEIESELASSYENLQLVTDEGMLDFYAYLIKAYEAKHKHLLKKLKEI